MPAPAEVRNVTVITAEGHFLIRADYAEPDRWRDVLDAITQFRHGAISVVTGCTYGPVAVGIEELDGAPTDVASGWDVVTERDFVSRESAHPQFELPAVHIANIYDSAPESVLTTRTGRLRIRFHARNRDEGRQAGDTTAIVEHFLMQVWPVAHAFAPATFRAQTV